MEMRDGALMKGATLMKEAFVHAQTAQEVEEGEVGAEALENLRALQSEINQAKTLVSDRAHVRESMGMDAGGGVRLTTQA